MKKNKYITNNRKSMTSYLFNTFENLDENSKKSTLMQILHLVNGISAYAIMVSNSKFCSEIKAKLHFSDLKVISRNKSLCVLAIKIDEMNFSVFIDLVVLNEERTEIFLSQDTKYIEFLKNVMKRNDLNFDYEIVINDNNQSYINLKHNSIHNNAIDKKLKQILSI